MGFWRYSLTAPEFDPRQAPPQEDDMNVNELEELFNNPPSEVEVDGHRLFVNDPLGEHDFTVNYTYGQVTTLEGATVSEVVEAARAGDGEIMVEIFLNSIADLSGDEEGLRNLPDGEVNVHFDGDAYPLLQGLQWSLLRLDDEAGDNWELTAFYTLV